MNENNSNIIECNLNDSNLFNCILEELGEADIDRILIDRPQMPAKTFINCLNASLVNCLRNNREELDFPRIQLKTSKNKSGDWLISQINIIVDRKFDEFLVYQRINQCLRFIRKACLIDDSVQLSTIHSEIKEELKHYKVELTKLNHLLETFKDDKLKKEKLFSLFKSMSSNK